MKFCIFKCIEIADDQLVDCLNKCQGNDCRVCHENYQTDVDNCPCNKNCPGETESLKIHVLLKDNRKFNFILSKLVVPAQFLIALFWLNLVSILTKMKIINFVSKSREIFWMNVLVTVKSLIVMLSATTRSTLTFENAHVLRNVLVSEELWYSWIILFLFYLIENWRVELFLKTTVHVTTTIAIKFKARIRAFWLYILTKIMHSTSTFWILMEVSFWFKNILLISSIFEIPEWLMNLHTNETLKFLTHALSYCLVKCGCSEAIIIPSGSYLRLANVV